MKRATGIGGAFFKVKDVAAINKWYHDHLGFKTTEWGATMVWGDTDPSRTAFGRTVWSPFKDTTEYFKPSTHPFMINYRVHDLKTLIDVLKAGGVRIAGGVDEYDYGKFAWILDPEDRKIELWEAPAAETPGEEPPPLWTDRVIGLSGIYFKSKDPEAIKEWYKKHLGIDGVFHWNDLTIPGTSGKTLWSPVDEQSEIFSGTEKPYLFSYRVNNITTLLSTLNKEGIPTSKDQFVHITDPEGNKIILDKS